jgi:hypothetical protein
MQGLVQRFVGSLASSGQMREEGTGKEPGLE